MLQDVEMWSTYEPKFARRVQPFWMKDIDTIVVLARKTLSQMHDVSENGKYHNYAGLCDKFINIFKTEFKHGKEIHVLPPNLEMKIHHGEIAHTTRSWSSAWSMRHTWISVTDGLYTIYVDGTTKQFNLAFFNETLPDYYIGRKAPVWYYDDKRNPRLSWISKNCKLVEKFIEFIQFKVHGTINDYIIEQRTLRDMQNYKY